MPSITIPDAFRLRIYNGACRIAGSRRLGSLTEERESRRLLDDVYNDEGIKYCLERGQWKFATRASKLNADTSITPAYGLKHAFQKPTDFIRTCYFCIDEYYKTPLLQYQENAGYWFADIDPVYVQYVSSDANYGRDTSRWTEAFIRFVEAEFAYRIVKHLTGSKSNKDDVMEERKMALETALSLDQIEGPQRRIPPGAFVAARFGRYGSRNNWGNNNNGLE